MELLATVVEVGAYSERQYQRHDTIYGELTGEAASKNRDTQFYQNQIYVVKGFWKQRVWGDNNDRHENVFYITDIQSL